MRRALLAGVAMLLLLPMLPVAVWAFSGQWRFPALVPQHPSSRGVRLLGASQGELIGGLFTSVTVAVAVSVTACAIGIPAGRALGLHRMRGRRAVQLALLAPVVVPGLAVTLGIQVLFIHLGLTATVTGVVLVHLIPTVPYVTLLMTAAFRTFDTDYERQARALGAGPVRTTIEVTLPLLRPAIVTAALIAFLISWNEYVLTLIVGAGQVKTLPILLFAAIASSDTTVAAFLALVLIALPLVLVAIATRTWTGSVRSLTAGPR